jgi:hypothetical protein
LLGAVVEWRRAGWWARSSAVLRPARVVIEELRKDVVAASQATDLRRATQSWAEAQHYRKRGAAAAV